MRSPLVERRMGGDLDAAAIPADPLDFLRSLSGPALIRMEGQDPSRTRVVTTLLHANEPSGLRAVHRFLRVSETPATNVLFYLGAVGTALIKPYLGHRALPGRDDGNRVWSPPWRSPEGRVAREVLDQIRAVRPEALVDLHNNTGDNPAYGVSFGISAAELSLASFFANRVVHTPIELHTLVEATHAAFPSVAIECGRAGDPLADEVAWRGLCRFLTEDKLDFESPIRSMNLLGAPVRVSLAPGFDLAFADQVDPKAAITISKDIDRHNFERLAIGSEIGWLASSEGWPLAATAAAGEECSRQLFEVCDGVLRTRREFIPIMMTTNREIARSDCLFYAVQSLALPEVVSGVGRLDRADSTQIGLVAGEDAWWR